MLFFCMTSKLSVLKNLLKQGVLYVLLSTLPNLSGAKRRTAICRAVIPSFIALQMPKSAALLRFLLLSMSG